jgi:hypothetical protein
MKPSLYLFSFIFLLAMACTLFQNTGILEEDVMGHAKTELSKKDNEKESSSGDDGDEDAGSDTSDSDYIGSSLAFNWLNFSVQTNSYLSSVNWYYFLSQRKNTPPPKI